MPPSQSSRSTLNKFGRHLVVKMFRQPMLKGVMGDHQWFVVLVKVIQLQRVLSLHRSRQTNSSKVVSDVIFENVHKS